jgi:hypothetical protein
MSSQGKVLSGGVLSDADREEAKSTLAHKAVELATVRAAAEKWQTGMAGTAGAIAAYVALRGSDDISELSEPWAAIVGVGIAASFAMVLAAGLFSMRAAFGLPKLRSTIQSDTFHRDHRSAIHAAGLLRIAMVLASVALIVAFLAIVTAWFAPTKAKGKVLFVGNNEKICGSVLRVVAGTATVKTADGERFVVLNNVQALSTTDKCP